MSYKNTLCAFLASSLLTASAYGNISDNQEAWQYAILDNNLSYQLTDSLTTQIGARMIGTEANMRAVDWAVSHFKQLGYDKVWTETFTFPLWVRGEASAFVESPFKQPLKVSALGGSIGTPKHGIKAEVVAFPSITALKKAQPKDVKGKIVYVCVKMQPRKNGSGYSEVVSARTHGANIAGEKGAIAYLVRSVGTDSNRMPHTGIMKYDTNQKIPALALSNPDADLLSREIISNKPVTLSLLSTAHYVNGKYGIAKNVIAEITGRKKPKDLVVLGAHLDSWDVGTGAVDDGIGVGIVMATGSLIKQYQGRPKRTLRVVLFNGEEFGLLGAKDYVKQHKDELANHTAGLEWDFGNGKIYELATRINDKDRSMLKSLLKKLEKYGVQLDSDNDASAQSDLSKLTTLGMPSFNLMPDGMTYFDVHHTDNDTLDKVNQKAMRINTMIYSLVISHLLNLEQRFRNI
jgi:carboxypeptidase Q